MQIELKLMKILTKIFIKQRDLKLLNVFIM